MRVETVSNVFHCLDGEEEYISKKVVKKDTFLLRRRRFYTCDNCLYLCVEHALRTKNDRHCYDPAASVILTRSV